ncbi:MAG: helix-turn-helix domain-containing protein [Phycisphaeraceae bacterium]|nr:helix-turn-helix domain-containing protein [Phycisphaeraceae bacterium]
MRGNNPIHPLSLRPKDAARALGIGERALWQLTRDGHIPHVKLGRCVLYPTDALRAWLAAKSAATVKGGPSNG